MGNQKRRGMIAAMKDLREVGQDQKQKNNYSNNCRRHWNSKRDKRGIKDFKEGGILREKTKEKRKIS